MAVVDLGRQRIYSANSIKVDPIFRALSVSTVDRKTKLSSSHNTGRPTSNLAIRQCRTCYDHLAGVAGVDLLNEMLRLRWLRKSKIKGKSGNINYELCESGLQSLKARGVDVEGAINSSRLFAYGCLDWTERIPHLGGSLGAAGTRFYVFKAGSGKARWLACTENAETNFHLD